MDAFLEKGVHVVISLFTEVRKIAERRQFKMSSSVLFRLGGIAGLLSGLFLAIRSVLPAGNHFGVIAELLSAVLLLYVLTALYLGQREASGTLGGIGYIVNSFGLSLFVGAAFAVAFVLSALSDNVVEELVAGSTGLALLVSLAIFALGVVLFGIATILAKVYSPVAAGLYMVGSVVSVVAIFVSLPEIIITIGSAVAAIGIAWFGYNLWSGIAENS